MCVCVCVCVCVSEGYQRVSTKVSVCAVNKVVAVPICSWPGGNAKGQGSHADADADVEAEGCGVKVTVKGVMWVFRSKGQGTWAEIESALNWCVDISVIVHIYILCVCVCVSVFMSVSVRV